MLALLAKPLLLRRLADSIEALGRLAAQGIEGVSFPLGSAKGSRGDVPVGIDRVPLGIAEQGDHLGRYRHVEVETGLVRPHVMAGAEVHGAGRVPAVVGNHPHVGVSVARGYPEVLRLRVVGGMTLGLPFDRDVKLA